VVVRVVVALLIAAGIVTGAPRAFAQESPPDPVAEAARLMDEGRELFVRTADYSGAIERFRRAYELAPSWQALNGIAAAQQKRGAYVEAVEAYEQLVREFGAVLSRDQLDVVDDELRALERRTAILDISAAQPGVRVVLDGRDIGVAPLRARVRVAPGAHVGVASGDRYDALLRNLVVSAGRTLPVTIALAVETMLVETTRVSRPLPVWTPWAGLAASAAMVAGGLVLHRSARSDLDDLDARIRAARAAGEPLSPVDLAIEADYDRADRKNTAAIALYVAGGVGAAASLAIGAWNKPRTGIEKRRVPRVLVEPGRVALAVAF
jgi:hypothetical protein